MRRNYCAAALLFLLVLLTALSGAAVSRYTQTAVRTLVLVQTCAREGDYAAACSALDAVVRQTERQTPYLALILRRNLLDKINETLHTPSGYASQENQADLEVELARAMEQLSQLHDAYFAWF